MSGERVVAVFSTDTKRTRATAVRTAERYGLPVSLYPPTDYTALVQRVVEQRGNVLIVGHSNTVPEIVGQLSGKAQPPMDESRYGDLFVIDLATREVSAERIGD
jgi:broad specificity phosphatase PhoE